MFEVTQPAGAANNSVGIFASNLSTAANAYAIWAAATGAATNKYAIVVPGGGGSVGIGTTTPGQLLTISPNAAMGFTLGGLPNPVMSVGAYGASPSDGIGLFAHDLTSGYVGWVGAIRVGNEAGGWGAKTLRFQVPDGGGSVLNALNILGGAGNVGIGITTPSVKLQVAGDILRTNTRVSSAQKYPLAHSGEVDAFYIDPTWSNAELQAYFGSANVQWLADATAPAGYCIQITGSVSVGGAYNSGFPYISIDQNASYYMECWIKTSAASNHYMGSIEYDENFANAGGNPGAYGYWVMSNTATNTSWTKVSGTISGFGASVGQFVTGKKYWTPQALFNYTNGAATCYISGWKVVKLSSANVASGSGNYIQNQYAGVQATSNYWISGEAKVGSWFRNSAANTGLYNETTGAGIYSPSANLMSTYNASNFQIDGASAAAGNLRFTAANPYITASSYFICPGGAYFNSGTVYTEAQYQCRGGIHNDAASSYLTIAGGTATNSPSYVSGYLGVGVTVPNEQLEISKNFRFPSTTGSTVGVIMQGANRYIHSYGTSNMFEGYQAGNFTTSGTGLNTGVGYQALTSLGTGYYNSAFGYRALASASGGTVRGNTAIGCQAMELGASSADTRWNTAVGYTALQKAGNASGLAQNNTAIGAASMGVSTTGSWNTAVGINTLGSNTTGTYNTAVGNSALIGFQTATDNTAIGAYSMYNSVSETGTGTAILGGSKNTCLGSWSGATVTSGTYNVCIGYAADASATLSNAISIGSNVTVTASNTGYFGNSSIGTLKAQVAWGTYSDGRIKNNVQENVPGLSFISQLRPVTYNYNIHKENEMLGVNSKDWEGKYDIEKISFSGFIAQEVESAARRVGYNFSGVDAPKNKNELYSLRYSEFVVPLVKAVQELNAQNQELQRIIQQMQGRIEALETSKQFETKVQVK